MPGQALALQGFPGIVYIKRDGTHSALGIVNDVVCNFVPVLVGFQLFEAEFENDLLVAGQLHPFDEAD